MQRQNTRDTGFPEPQEIDRMATLVAREMYQSRGPKGHGEYRVYDDGRLRISLDTDAPDIPSVAPVDPGMLRADLDETPEQVPNLDIRVLRNGVPERVYRTMNHTAQLKVYRTGRWIRHLRNLSLEAGRIRDEKKADRETKLQLEEAAKTSPIYDRDIFPEL